MKKFIITVSIIVAAVILFDTAYYRLGWYIDIHPEQPVETFTTADENDIYIDEGNGYKPFTVKGVNIGSGLPAEWSTDFAIDKKTYLRWFKQIQEMGANTIRIYTVLNDTFYEAFYEYNTKAEKPLWLMHGVWVNDYVQYSHRDAYDKKFYDTFKQHCKMMVDVVHGNKKISLGRMASAGSGNYRKDISQWVIGYILGVEWEPDTVAFTDDKYRDDERCRTYKGKYMYTSEDASPFEAMLARIGDSVIEYESERYKQQRLVAFSNWPTTDPFVYPENITKFFSKGAFVDVNHIKTTDKFIAGQFASYHVYPYYPDYLYYMDDLSYFDIENTDAFLTENGKINTYRAYLSMLTKHHNMPVLITEFGVSTGRGIAQIDQNTGRNQGNMSETQQGHAQIECYEDIIAAGCKGGCVFSWQDEWFKRTWNTMYAVNLRRTPYWSDYQTNEQYFGLLSFDPGKKKSVSYVDGDVSEWKSDDIIVKNDDISLSLKYDEKFIYYLVNKKDFDFNKETVYIPIDITPKSGSSYCKNYNLLFDKAADFLIVINGKSGSSIKVQERYEVLKSTYSESLYQFDAYIEKNIPDIDSPLFKDINMILRTDLIDNPAECVNESLIKSFNTGKLTYGNANPESDDFNSLADFIVNGDYIEIKLPWQLLNFADPSRMTIHDDYYDGNYGIEYIDIDSIFAGVSIGNQNGRIHLAQKKLKGWENSATYHERLKPSYYMMQEYWRDDK